MEFWLSWLYSYGVGGILFFGTLFTLISQGAIRLNREGDRKLVFALVAGFTTFLTLHGLWLYAALPSGVAK